MHVEMEESTTKEKVLKRIRNALISKSANPYPDLDMAAQVYEPFSDTPEVVFAQEFTKVGGKFVFCETQEELISDLETLIEENDLKPLFCSDNRLFNLLTKSGIHATNDPSKFATLKAAITFCEFLIARHGSIMVSSRSGPGRRINVFPDVHIVLAHSSQMVDDLKQAFSALREKYPQRLPSMISVVTGPSRTADIEKTLVMGAHGPKELFLFLLDDSF